MPVLERPHLSVRHVSMDDMCGRYAATADPGSLALELDAIDETDHAEQLRPEEQGPNYNVAPTNKVLTVVRRHDHGADADRAPRNRIRRMRWGLIPHWTKAAEPGVPVKGKPLFNARADTAATTPAFRSSLAHRRCLVPMDGWYEWLTEPGEAGKAVKTPYFMSRSDDARLYMAGLWSVWGSQASERVLSCTVLTTDAVGELQRIHHRMPLIMPKERWTQWLDPDHPAPADLLEPPSEGYVADIELRPVSSAVNSVKNNDPELTARVAVAEQVGLDFN